MALNNTEKYLFGASSALIGLGLQYFLPIEQQIQFNRIALIGLGVSIIIVYYCTYTLIYTLKRLSELIKKELEYK